MPITRDKMRLHYLLSKIDEKTKTKMLLYLLKNEYELKEILMRVETPRSKL